MNASTPDTPEARALGAFLAASFDGNVGTATAGNSDTEPCPNGCGPLWPVTWKEAALEAREAVEQWFERAIAAEKRLEALKPRAVGVAEQEGLADG